MAWACLHLVQGCMDSGCLGARCCTNSALLGGFRSPNSIVLLQQPSNHIALHSLVQHSSNLPTLHCWWFEVVTVGDGGETQLGGGGDLRSWNVPPFYTVMMIMMTMMAMMAMMT